MTIYRTLSHESVFLYPFALRQQLPFMFFSLSVCMCVCVRERERERDFHPFPFNLSRMSNVAIQPFEIFWDTWYKYKAPSDDVQRTRIVTPPIFLTELCPLENICREVVSAE